MAPRSRTIQLYRNVGTAVKNGQWIGGGTYVSGFNDVDDVTGPGDNQLFQVDKFTTEGGEVNETPSSSFDSGFYNYVAQGYRTEANFPHVPIGNPPSLVSAATSAAARTSPSRPYVDVMTDLLQLGEIVKLVQTEGRSFIRHAARENIKFQFGVLPLVNDIRKLLNVEEQVKRRVLEIERLRGPKGLRRTVTIGKYTGEQTKNLTVQSLYRLINRTVKGTTVQVTKAHVRWKPSVSLAHLNGPRELRAQARRAVLGSTVDMSTIWELIPWSWLIDWGTNVGEYLKLHRNIIPATLSSVTTTRHAVTDWYGPGFADSNWSIAPFHARRTFIHRDVIVPALTAHWPFLTARQVGILGSLSVIKAPRL